MDENMDYIPEEDYAEDPAPDDTAVSGETDAEIVPSDPGDIRERIDSLLEQIGAGQSYGSMGDYYVAEAGCYAFPGEDVFFHFIGEEVRSGWTAASNGCYVPMDSLDAYEAYLSYGIPDEEEETENTEEAADGSLPPPVTQEDLAGLGTTLQAICEQDAVYHTAVLMNCQEMAVAQDNIQSYLGNIFIVGIVICFFLALLCGAKFADVFFSRMRAG